MRILNDLTEVNRRVAGLKTLENASLESLKSLEKRIGSMLKRAEKSIKSFPCDKDIQLLLERTCSAMEQLVDYGVYF